MTDPKPISKLKCVFNSAIYLVLTPSLKKLFFDLKFFVSLKNADLAGLSHLNEHYLCLKKIYARRFTRRIPL